ncbi:antitoxin Xre/MbcA/ParS toxin-binding domain-containing protein [Pseudopedobacter beijingensis]|uniref:Antitoxin Xre/MbcA/ParS toxin-binding domain-containing protein n=1 Tax=Pseudopedobacter beijingensis TaxID=1207056 RepID=A0ABW4IGK9_9SPHI
MKSYQLDDNNQNIVEETISFYHTLYDTPVSLLSVAKKGLRAKAALDFIAVSGFTYDQFQETFKTTVKTIQNYAGQDLKLDAALSEKLLKSFSLFEQGIEVFGSVKAFHDWLKQPSIGLGDQIPFEIMDTITGITLIEEELLRIAYGALA